MMCVKQGSIKYMFWIFCVIRPRIELRPLRLYPLPRVLSTSRMWRQINFQVEFNTFEFSVSFYISCHANVKELSISNCLSIIERRIVWYIYFLMCFVKCKQPRRRFEHKSPCSFSTAVTVSPWVHMYLYKNAFIDIHVQIYAIVINSVYNCKNTRQSTRMHLSKVSQYPWDCK